MGFRKALRAIVPACCLLAGCVAAAQESSSSTPGDWPAAPPAAPVVNGSPKTTTFDQPEAPATDKNGIVPPVLRTKPQSNYAEVALRKRAFGTYRIAFTVGTDGKPKDARLENSIQPDTDRAVLDYVKGFRYSPAIKDQQPVPYPVHVTIKVSAP